MNTEEVNIIKAQNSHQVARIERNDGMIDYESSSDLTYNEMISLSKGLHLMSEFYDVKAACSVRGSNVCAVALGQSLTDAVQKIMDSDPIDFISAIIIVSAEIDSEMARFFKDTNLIVAPKFTQSALEILKAHNVRYVTINTSLKDYKKYLSEEIKVTPLGTLVQSPNMSELVKDSFDVVSKIKPTVEQIEDAVFAWKISKHIYSQALVIAKDLKTTAIAHGLQSASVEFALDYSCDMSKDAILASDMPITLHDLNVASQGRIKLVIVPSATKEIIAQADKYEMVLITTGITNVLY